VERALKTGRFAQVFRAACRPGEGLASAVLSMGGQPVTAMTGLRRR
jgi:hypothetical protein